MTTSPSFFATTPKGLELLLVDELKALGAVTAAEKLAGVVFTGDLSVAYRACLWSRLANRILLRLGEFGALTPDALYEGIGAIAWDEHFDVSHSFAIQLVTVQSEINHSLFAAQKVKDAIVDQFREKYGERPNVERDQPDISIYVYLYRNQATVYLDLSGDSLHKRGYRLSAGAAPLKENLAAAVLLRARWPEIANGGGALLDPMCGSGTLLIEGALMAADIAPGLLRSYFGFQCWKQHQVSIWQSLWEEAEQRRMKGLGKLPLIAGYDADSDMIPVAFENIERAGLRGNIHVEKRDLTAFEPLSKMTPGLIATNPPYGERLGDISLLAPLYTQLGTQLKQHFKGWQAAVLAGNPDLGKEMGLRAHHYYALFNGAIACKLLLFKVEDSFFVDRSEAADNERRIRAAQRAIAGKDDTAIQMFINRLQKNMKHQLRQAEPDKIYRIYDADLPEYAFAIDLKQETAHVSEYPPPRSVDPEKAQFRRHAILAVLPNVLGLPPKAIFFTILPREKKIR